MKTRILSLVLFLLPAHLAAASNGWYRDVLWCQVEPESIQKLQAWGLSKGLDEAFSMETILARNVRTIPAPHNPCEEGPLVYRWDESEEGLAALLTQRESHIRVLLRFADQTGAPRVLRKTVYYQDRFIDDVTFVYRDGHLVHTVSDRYGIEYVNPPSGRSEVFSRFLQTAFYRARHFVLGLFRG